MASDTVQAAKAIESAWRRPSANGLGIGVGFIFGKTIEAVGRQPEMRGQLQGMMWLGFALTEAIVFYALGMSFVAVPDHLLGLIACSSPRPQSPT